MKTSVIISGMIAVVALGVAVWQWRAAEALREENSALRAQLDASHAAPAAAIAEDPSQRDAELQKLRGELQELVRLRGEVTKLRTESKEMEKLRAENQKLRSDGQQLRTAVPASVAPSAPQTNLQAIIRREQWTFAGYQTPEAALVSAIWSMQQGDPKQYFESLTPEEQSRMSKAWEGKSADEIIAKQKNDTAQITAIRVLQTDATSDAEQIVTVAIYGANRQEKVRMQRIGNDWKFGGFIREPNK